MLKTKHVKAVKEYKAMKDVFDQLSKSMSKNDINQWNKEAEKADFLRGDNLKIYGIDTEKGMGNLIYLGYRKFSKVYLDPSQISIKTKLKSKKTSEDSMVNWLCLGLDIEEQQ